MSNTWFQFKQFLIRQDACAMKVTTDACIQGAWTPIKPDAAQILDIGTGTGLLSLMLAQRNANIHIDAVEYDAAAAQEAAENIAASPWANRITVTHNDIRAHETNRLYDMIICNPPFFANSLLSDVHTRNIARHNISLTRYELLQAVIKHLAEDGSFSLLLPLSEYQQWQPLIKKMGLWEQQTLHIKHRPEAAVKRVVSIITKHKNTPKANEQILTIQDNDGRYTAAFTALMADFYLNL